jgi:hypothetical protein
VTDWRLLPELGPPLSEEERAELLELSKEPDVAAATARAMALLERPLPIKPGEVDELREALRFMEFQINVARTKRWGKEGPSTGTIRINGNTQFSFRSNHDRGNLDHIKYGSK